MADVNLDKASLYALTGAGEGDIGVEKASLYALTGVGPGEMGLEKGSFYALTGAAAGEIGIDKLTLYALYSTLGWTAVWVKLRNATDGFWVRAPDNALSFNVKVDGWEL